MMRIVRWPESRVERCLTAIAPLATPRTSSAARAESHTDTTEASGPRPTCLGPIYQGSDSPAVHARWYQISRKPWCTSA